MCVIRSIPTGEYDTSATIRHTRRGGVASVPSSTRREDGHERSKQPQGMGGASVGGPGGKPTNGGGACPPAWAAPFSVTTPVDELNTDGDCSLREAIEAANTNAAVDGCAAGSATVPDTIVFAVGPEATVSLSSELDVLLYHG